MKIRIMPSLYHPAILTPVLTLGQLLVERDLNLALVVLSLVAAGVCRLSSFAMRQGPKVRV